MRTAAARTEVTALPAPAAAGCALPAQLPRAEARERPRPGSARLEVVLVGGRSAVVACASTSPLRLLLPRPRGATAWAVAASHGGGLVGGDRVEVEVEVGPGARALLTSQAETKVYRSVAGPACQALRARVAEGAVLALLPEPVSAFAGSTFRQVQHLELAPGGSLVLLDALAAGRTARGERWAFDELSTRNQVAVGGRPVLADALRLSARAGPPVAARLPGVELLATLVLLGPRLAAPARALLAELSARPAEAGAGLLCAASPLADGLHLRLAAASVEAGSQELRRLLAFLPALLEEDPLARRP